MKKKMISEYYPDSKTSFSVEINKRLIRKKTKYQTIEVYKTKKLGNLLVLDGCFMFTDADHYLYHQKCYDLIKNKESLKNILIVGGGDFGIVKQLSQLTKIHSLTLIEIDSAVIQICKKFFPNFFKIRKSFCKKINIVCEDGYKWIKNNTNKKFDLIIVDCTDPTGIAKKLFSKRFFKYVHRILKKSSQYIQQSGSPIVNRKNIISPMQRNLKEIGFCKIKESEFPMPSYPLGLWSFISSQK